MSKSVARSSSYKIDYCIVIKNFLNPEGHQNPMSGSKVTPILLKGWILPIGGASSGEGHRINNNIDGLALRPIASDFL